MLPSLEAPLELSGMRGDAIFAYAIESDIVANQFMLDMAEKNPTITMKGHIKAAE